MNNRLPGFGHGWRMMAAVLLPLAILLASARLGAVLPERSSVARSYFYLEPHSARFECLVRLPEMMALLGLAPEDTLPVESQQRVRDEARARTADWLRVKLGGEAEPATATFRAMIVKGVPGRTDALKPGEAVVAGEAMLGLVWEYELPSVPDRIEIRWSGFSETFSVLETSIIAGSQSEDHELNVGAPSCTWENRGRLALRQPLAAVPPLPPAETIRIPLGSIVWSVFGVIFLSRQFRRGRKIPGRLLMTLMTILFGAAILWPVAPVEVTPPWAGVAPVTPDQAERVLTPLLRNVYRAFDQREEGAIYDVLERSIEGDLLQRIYLQTVSALTLDAQDSTRARVSDLDVRVDGVRMLPQGRGFVADAQWTALGTVGHWGHQHQRINRYTAKVTVAAVPLQDGKPSGPAAWKVTALEVEQETRM